MTGITTRKLTFISKKVYVSYKTLNQQKIHYIKARLELEVSYHQQVSSTCTKIHQTRFFIPGKTIVYAYENVTTCTVYVLMYVITTYNTRGKNLCKNISRSFCCFCEI